jgi:hypothetical protein
MMRQIPQKLALGETFSCYFQITSAVKVMGRRPTAAEKSSCLFLWLIYAYGRSEIFMEDARL